MPPTCRNNGDTTWTYNQGVLLGGLVALARATGDDAYLERARELADASTTSEALHVDGVLTEPCEQSGCDVNGPSFKGIYVRNLGELNRALDDHPYSDYLIDQAATAYDNEPHPGQRVRAALGRADPGRQRRHPAERRRSPGRRPTDRGPTRDARSSSSNERVRQAQTCNPGSLSGSGTARPSSWARKLAIECLGGLVGEAGQFGSFSGIEILRVDGAVRAGGVVRR